jgi:hypothetical protein
LPVPTLLPPPRIDQRGGDLSREFLPTGLGLAVLRAQLTDAKPPGDSDPYQDSPRFAAGAGGEITCRGGKDGPFAGREFTGPFLASGPWPW